MKLAIKLTNLLLVACGTATITFIVLAVIFELLGIYYI